MRGLVAKTVFVTSVAIGAASSYGQVLDCEALPDARQGLCRELVACLTVADDDRRDRCIDAAQRQSKRAAPQTPKPSAAKTPRPAARTDVPKLVTISPAAKPPEAQSPNPRPAQAPRPPDHPFTIPDEFTAEVTAIRTLILNRRIVALDNRYVFDGDRAGEAHLELSQQVDVKRSGGFFSRWRIVGPNKRPFTATRIRCEREELGVHNRRKCSLLKP